MSWSGLANNQTVSFNNLQNAVSTGVFTAKTSIPASNEQITKADANTYVNIDTAYAPYAAKASNQLVVKSDLVTSSGCECWTVVNGDVVTVNYSWIDCNGTPQTANLASNATRIHCIQGGSSFTINSPVGANLFEYDCGTGCVTSGGCPDCQPV